MTPDLFPSVVLTARGAGLRPEPHEDEEEEERSEFRVLL